MDHLHIDAVTRRLSSLSPRRHLLGGLVATGLGFGAARLSSLTDARKKRKHKRTKRAKPNAFGCLEVNDPCTSAEQCCSGVCEGKKGKRKCRAHDSGTCAPQPGFCADPNSLLVPCNNTINCSCLRTTANSLFCADLNSPTACADCRQDADCVAQGYPAGSACVPVFTGACTGACESGMMCMAPCAPGPLPGSG